MIAGFGGGNNYNFYMSALRGMGGTFVEVGAKGERHVNFDMVRLENRSFVIETTEYLPDDPMCCPSKPGYTKFEIAGGNIRKLAITP